MNFTSDGLNDPILKLLFYSFVTIGILMVVYVLWLAYFAKNNIDLRGYPLRQLPGEQQLPREQ